MHQMKLLLLGALLLGVSGCSESPADYFRGNPTDYSPDYGLYKKGTEHVISIHGFAEDYEICMEIAASFNIKEPGQYTCVQLDE